ncbi:hypothetical protein SLA2020_270570 [Shorea laevis]
MISLLLKAWPCGTILLAPRKQSDLYKCPFSICTKPLSYHFFCMSVMQIVIDDLFSWGISSAVDKSIHRDSSLPLSQHYTRLGRLSLLSPQLKFPPLSRFTLHLGYHRAYFLHAHQISSRFFSLSPPTISQKNRPIPLTIPIGSTLISCSLNHLAHIATILSCPSPHLHSPSFTSSFPFT